jgi:ribosomal subunit interface protein
MLDIVVTGRHVDVPARLRAYAQEKLAKVEKLRPKAIRVDVEISRERNPRMSEICDRVQLTCVSRGPAIRAEAAADGLIAAFDLAWAKLEARLRKSADRRRVHRGSRAPISVATATAALGTPADVASAGAEPAALAERAEPAEPADPYDAMVEQDGEGPMVVREKLHRAVPMNLDQALYEMELVGHDFFLFADKDTGLPSVVYRRRGYDYGVIRIDTNGAIDDDADAIAPKQVNGARMQVR